MLAIGAADASEQREASRTIYWLERQLDIEVAGRVKAEAEVERLQAENAELRKRPNMKAGHLDVEEFYAEE
jgi:hypothetical protein